MQNIKLESAFDCLVQRRPNAIAGPNIELQRQYNYHGLTHMKSQGEICRDPEAGHQRQQIGQNQYRSHEKLANEKITNNFSLLIQEKMIRNDYYRGAQVPTQSKGPDQNLKIRNQGLIPKTIRQMACRSNEAQEKKTNFTRNGSGIESKPHKSYREMINEQIGKQRGLRFGGFERKTTNKENLCSNGDLKSGNKFTKFIKSIQNSNNINVRRNYGSNDSHTNAAPHKKHIVTNKFSSKSKEKTGFALRKNSKAPVSNYHNLKGTINNFSNLARFNPVSNTGSENVSLNEGSFVGTAIKNFPLRDITKQVQELNEELMNEYNYDHTISTESDQKEEFAHFVRSQIEGRAAHINYNQGPTSHRFNENRPSMSNCQLINSNYELENQSQKQNIQQSCQIEQSASNYITNQLKKQIQANQLNQHALFENQNNQNQINSAYSAQTDTQTNSQNQYNENCQNLLVSQESLTSLEMTDKENTANAIMQIGKDRVNIARAASNGYPGIKTQQIVSQKASGLLTYSGLNSTASNVSSLRQKIGKAPSFRVSQNQVTQKLHSRHFKSHSNVSSNGDSTPQEVAPLRVNTNFTNVSNNTMIQINNLNAKNKNFAKNEENSKTENQKPLRGGIPMPQPSSQKLEKLAAFRDSIRSHASSGALHNLHLQDHQICLQQKELLENARKAPSTGQYQSLGAVTIPIMGHEVTKEYRTKMMDWMVEVCTSFKCSNRTYFLAAQIFDKYIIRVRQLGRVLMNKHVHCIGVTSMYLASKYEDIFPLHSKIVADKIAHRAIPAKDILVKEQEFLKAFDFQIDFVTHYDFHQTYCDKIERLIGKSKNMNMIKEMSMVLVKMSIQNIEFQRYSQSIVVIASLYASTAFLKHSKKHESTESTNFCTNTRKIIFDVVHQEVQMQNKFLSEGSFSIQLEKFMPKQNQDDYLKLYQSQFNPETIEKVAMDLVDFFKVFDEWHCGLNQLKKFNKIPIE